MLPARSTILRDRRLTKRARFRAGRSGSLGASASVGALLRRARPSETARSRLPYGFASAAVWGWRKPCAQRATLEAFSVEAWSKPRSERTLVTVLTKPNGEGRMSFMLMIPWLIAFGIYNPQVMHHGHCIAQPGTFDALYCPAPAAPSHHPHR